MQNVHTIENVPLPKQTIDKNISATRWPYLNGIDFTGFESANPELLIGEIITTRDLIQRYWNTPIASRIWSDWTLSGSNRAPSVYI